MNVSFKIRELEEGQLRASKPLSMVTSTGDGSSPQSEPMQLMALGNTILAEVLGVGDSSLAFSCILSTPLNPMDTKSQQEASSSSLPPDI